MRYNEISFNQESEDKDPFPDPGYVERNVNRVLVRYVSRKKYDLEESNNCFIQPKRVIFPLNLLEFKRKFFIKESLIFNYHSFKFFKDYVGNSSVFMINTFKLLICN